MKVVFIKHRSTFPFDSGQLQKSYESKLLERLSTLTADAACKLHVLGHDGDTLGMDSAQVGVLKQTHEVSLGSLLQSQNS